MFQRRSQPPMRGEPRIVAGRLRNDGAVVERAHGAEFDDAERLLVEAVAALHEEDRSRAVELDENGDDDEQRRQREQAERRADQIEHALLHHFDACQRQPGQLQARQRADLGELDLVEFVQDLFGAKMDLHRQRQEGLGAALDDLGRRPRQQQVDGVGLERADARHRLGQIAVERRAPCFGGCRQSAPA